MTTFEQHVAESIESPFRPGSTWLFRTVTYHWTGRVVRTFGNFVAIQEAAWIADSGRLSDFLSGKAGAKEVEPCEQTVWISLTALTDAIEFPHPLPRKQV